MGTVKLIAALDNESRRRLLSFRRGLEAKELRARSSKCQETVTAKAGEAR